ncbi:MAG TPA: hypothetical protein VER58_03735 [Thermoanaerobaculia bacterium]|nr:hypothetical protein [Thermoanaerobaculia bacterium]
MDARFIAAVAAVSVLVVAVWQRRLLFSFSCIGAFFITNVIIVLTGVISHPFFPTAVDYSGVDLSLFVDSTVAKAIVLNAGGALGIVLVYQLTHLIIVGRFVTRRPNVLAGPATTRLGLSVVRTVIASLAILLFVLVFVVRNGSILSAGILKGLMLGRDLYVIEMRRTIGENYLTMLVLLNCVPFIGVALWLAARHRSAPLLYVFAVLYNVVALAALILTFQKRPVLLYLIALSIAEVWCSVYRRRKVGMRRKLTVATIRRRALIALVAVFCSLMGLYYAHSAFARGSEDEAPSFFHSVSILALVSAKTIVYGISLPAIMHVHYFPAVEPYYGIWNIRMVSNLTGHPLYKNNIPVFEYFYHQTGGSVAIPALMDFYGAFGLIGWGFGVILLGVLLERLDWWLLHLRPTASRTLLAIFLFWFAYYLSHASLANSLLGYGGGIFVALWLFVSVRFGNPHYAVLARLRAPVVMRAVAERRS